MLAAYLIVKAMKLTVKGMNLTVTPSLRRYVEVKLVRAAEKLLGGGSAYQAVALDIDLVHRTRRHKKGNVWEAAANLQLPGKSIWQKAVAEELYAAIDGLEDIFRIEIKKYKERSRSRELRGARQAKKDWHLSRSARLYRKSRIREEGM